MHLSFKKRVSTVFWRADYHKRKTGGYKTDLLYLKIKTFLKLFFRRAQVHLSALRLQIYLLLIILLTSPWKSGYDEFYIYQGVYKEKQLDQQTI